MPSNSNQTFQASSKVLWCTSADGGVRLASVLPFTSIHEGAAYGANSKGSTNSFFKCARWPSLRVKHMQQLNRAATPDECARMADDLQSALQAGAIGMSTGVYYPPAQSATAEELIAVGASLQSAGGMVAMHIRDEGDAITAALREAL